MTENDMDRIHYFGVDGSPAITAGLVVMTSVNGSFVAVLPSAVLADHRENLDQVVN